MGARTKARKRALDILFESELRSLPVGGTLGDRWLAHGDPLGEDLEHVGAALVGLEQHVEGTLARLRASSHQRVTR